MSNTVISHTPSPASQSLARHSTFKRVLERLCHCERGAILVEFAIILSLLLLTLGTAIEMTRMWMVSRSFENTVDGVGRMVGRFPEYDNRVRKGAPILASNLFRGGDWKLINVKVDSLAIEQGKYRPVFESEILLGKDPGISWEDEAIPADEFINSTSLIYITASYEYRPLLSNYLGNQTITLTKSFALHPYFARNYNYNAGTSDDLFVD